MGEVKLTTAHAAYDRTGREIMLGDVLKVFHFVGARKKRHYMFKQVVAERRLGGGNPYWFVSHLSLNAAGYHLPRDGRCHSDIEIVQSVDARFFERPRVTAGLSALEGRVVGDE